VCVCACVMYSRSAPRCIRVNIACASTLALSPVSFCLFHSLHISLLLWDSSPRTSSDRPSFLEEIDSTWSGRCQLKPWQRNRFHLVRPMSVEALAGAPGAPNERTASLDLDLRCLPATSGKHFPNFPNPVKGAFSAAYIEGSAGTMNTCAGPLWPEGVGDGASRTFTSSISSSPVTSSIAPEVHRNTTTNPTTHTCFKRDCRQPTCTEKRGPTRSHTQHRAAQTSALLQ
jgi:hypothetical protein